MCGPYRSDIKVGILCGLSLYETAAFINDKAESLATYRHYGDTFITALKFAHEESYWGEDRAIQDLYRFLRDGHIDV